ncbi:hypothetical protein PU629_17660 [Pullulanibacillus sp. KACC 23026]|uniref:hypothetical protein n=1 Tax=Pullulanibacillus sp. KACC 23026 TaxID=3028315 RepID=UPI0023B0E3A2|nr:hypothetical protein [Pullulanibacillus sp. KACC 23026]WEG11934.1 hypothetical protein PU629_17660 [Pullulanibacillus sp. KACC 23026]
MGIIIYGGLNDLGDHLITSFLDEGIETWAIKSNVRNEEEEEHEMFFGRHALFHSEHSEERQVSDENWSTVCFLLPEEGFAETEEDLLLKLDSLIKDHPIKTILLIRADEEGEEEKEQSPITKIERRFQDKINQTLEKRKDLTLAIIRAPLTRLLATQQELRPIFAEQILKLIGQKRKAGIHFYEMVVPDEGNGEDEKPSNSRLILNKVDE